MNAISPETAARYESCIRASKRVRWDIEADVFRGRGFTLEEKFLPDGLVRPDGFPALDEADKRLIGQIQGRTYANVFGLVERYINAKILELSRDYVLGDQTALEALVRFGDEELKHQALFRRVEKAIGDVMPPGYRFDADPNAVARAVLGKSTWAVLGLTLHIELFTQVHYVESIKPDAGLSALFKDVFLFHWKEESQHAIIDELEWRRCDAALTAQARDAAVDDLIALIGAVDGILRAQAENDARYFARARARDADAKEVTALVAGFLGAYRWQFIHSGVEHRRFVEVLGELVSEDQVARLGAAIGALR